MRRVSAAVVGVALAVSPCWFGATPAFASCVAPTVAVSPSHAVPGQSVVVTGEGWEAGCADTVVNGTPAPAPPPDRVRLEFVQSGVHTTLATMTATASDTFRATVVVPSSAAAGAAEIEAVGEKTGFTTTVPLVVDRSGSGLPFTGGADLAAFVALGALACGVGAVVVWRS